MYSIVIAFLFLCFSSCLTLDMSIIERCCDTGASMGLSAAIECHNLPKVSGINADALTACRDTMSFCCERERILHECSAGIKHAKSAHSCIPDHTGFNCSTLAQTCCTACLLSETLSESGADCKLPGPATISLAQVNEACCPEKESEEAEEEEDPYVKLNLCDKMADQLCGHICVATPNSYYCTCRKGYTLMEDQKTCQPEKQKPKPTNPSPQILPNPERPVPLKKPVNISNVIPDSNVIKCADENNCEHICTDSDSGPVCSCRTGYDLHRDQKHCIDINECLHNVHVCDPQLEVCKNEIGSYRCETLNLRTTPPTIFRSTTQTSLTTSTWDGTTTEEDRNRCLLGYERQGNHCVDIDECDSQTHPEVCEPHEGCVNTMGSYVCRCDHGFHKETPTGTCVDINECQQNSHNCAPEQRCDNTIGSFLCHRLAGCGTGYTLNANTGLCEDDDECLLQTDNCRYLSGNFQCRNTLGSFRCERKRCHPGEANCTEAKLCPAGFTESSIGHCVDVDECKEKLHNCKAFESCINRVGTFECRQFRFCPKGFLATATGCDDVDECALGQHNCEHPAQCQNFNGGFSCSCPQGYHLVESKRCEDINECLRYVCPPTSTCINTPGSYQCNCKYGFRQVNPQQCEDLDECSNTPGPCEHRCVNVYGSYRCSCNAGFYLHDNNRTCEDIDECSKFGSNTLCIGNCVNTPGSFICSCPPGYSLRGDGRTCHDIDECTSNPCRGEDQVCLNSHGSHMCKAIRCPVGYVKDAEQLNKCRRLPCDYSEQCLQRPMSYSYNYIPFVSMLPIPSSGYIDLFTMRGPLTANTETNFEMHMLSANAPSYVPRTSKEYFRLRVPAPNQAVIALARSIHGPQEIELQLVATIYHNGAFSGKAVASIFIIVSQYEF